MIDHPIGTSIGRMVVDCMGDEPRRELSGDVFKASQVLISSCPWNYAQHRRENVDTLLHSFRSMLRFSNRALKKFFVFCKKGERRSAAVLMVILCEVYNFSRHAAKSQIEDRRSRAKLTTDYEHGFPPTWVEVNQLLDQRHDDL